MKRKILLYAVIAIALAVVVLKPFGDSEQIAEAKSRVSAELKDPASAQFKDVEQVGDRVCGEVNARNSFGGYTGYQKFYVRGEEVLLGQPSTDPDALLQNARVAVKCVEHLTEEANKGVKAAEVN